MNKSENSSNNIKNKRLTIPRILVAGAHSGSGKTTLTLGLLSLFKKQGLDVRSFKVGPDFIDPGHHSRITGLPSRNLDSWMLSKEYNLKTFTHHAQGADLALIEGVMGLFDGISGIYEGGSSAQIAKWLSCPVILIVNCRSMARSVAALIQGYEHFDKQVHLAGVIFNQVGSPSHFAHLKEAVEIYCQTEVLGYLPRHESLIIQERHLGLVTAEEGPLGESFLNRLSLTLEINVNIGRILALAKDSQEIEVESASFPESAIFADSVHLPESSPEPSSLSSGSASYFPARVDLERCHAHHTHHAQDSLSQDGIRAAGIAKRRVGIAKDEAFCFYYQDNLDLLKQAGAELLFFSPLRDRSIPDSCDALYLGGGYPELFGLELSQNRDMIDSMKRFIEEGGRVLAECGGFIYLTRGIHNFDQRFFPLADIFPVCSRMEKRIHLGYREIHLTEDCPLGPAGNRIRGHEFHYSTTEAMPDTIKRVYAGFDWRVRERKIEGFQYKNCLAGYPHLHFGSNQESVYFFLQKF